MILKEKELGKVPSLRDLVQNISNKSNKKLPSIGSILKIWKQETSQSPSDVYLHTEIENGPKDSQIKIKGVKAIKKDKNNIFLPDLALNSEQDYKQLDAVHTYAVARMTLTFFQRTLRQKLVFEWNKNRKGKAIPVTLVIRADIGRNAKYVREEKQILFGYDKRNDDESKSYYTCRSFDIVAHEMGHLVLDSLKPSWHPSFNTEIGETSYGAIHEAFSDCTVMFMILSQFDLVEKIITDTRSNLRENSKNFLSILAERFGKKIGEDVEGLRKFSKRGTLSMIKAEDGPTKYDYSLVFSNAIYEIISDLFAVRRFPRFFDDAMVLHQASQEVASFLLRAIIEAPDKGANFTHIAENMKEIAIRDMKLDCAEIIHKHFVIREIIIEDGKHPSYKEVNKKVDNTTATNLCLSTQIKK